MVGEGFWNMENTQFGSHLFGSKNENLIYISLLIIWPEFGSQTKIQLELTRHLLYTYIPYWDIYCLFILFYNPNNWAQSNVTFDKKIYIYCTYIVIRMRLGMCWKLYFMLWEIAKPTERMDGREGKKESS